MSNFAPRAAGSTVTPPDATKHVNYSLGMVLGVDDFTQEFAYLTGRDQWAARDVLGYGTVEGLRVKVDYETGAPEVVVEPGAAVSPRGQLIRVTPAQCAGLNDWLAQERNRARLGDLPPGGGTVSLFVVLSYRECATDRVPIPGEPCRSEEESMADSRLADNFRLELSLDPPDQREHDALRDFVAWLEDVEITDEPGGGGFVTLEQFIEEVRHAMHPSSPPSSPPAQLRVHVADACEYLRAAFRIWVTELRPSWLGLGQTADGALPFEEGILLAELLVPVVPGADTQWVAADRTTQEIVVDEERRPILLHLSAVQEWVECGRHVRYPGDTVAHETSFGQSPSAGASEAYSRADHTHGTPQLTGDVTLDGAGRTVVGRLKGVEVVPDGAAHRPVPGQVLMYSATNQWVAGNVSSSAQQLGGDVTGPVGANTLSRIRNVVLDFDPATASDGQVLTYSVGSSGPPPIDESSAVAPEGDVAPEGIGRLARWVPSDLLLQGARVVSAAKAGSPTEGQVLTFVTGEREGEGSWRASTPQTSDPLLQGDVTGPASETTVKRLFGTDVADFSVPTNAPRDGQVLTFVQRDGEARGVWRAGAAPASGSVALGGDVTGAPDQNLLTRIQGFPIVNRSAPGPFIDGDVLTFRGGQWVPEGQSGKLPPPPDTSLVDTTPAAVGAFVERPKDLPAYAIIAAGTVRGDGTSRAPTYNGLVVRGVRTGTVTVTFNDYLPPDDTFQYVVKALPVFNRELPDLTNVVVMFDSFLQTAGNGFVLRVTNAGQSVDAERLGSMELMIEVSRYQTKV
jgi:hypothetical protein